MISKWILVLTLVTCHVVYGLEDKLAAQRNTTASDHVVSPSTTSSSQVHASSKTPTVQNADRFSTPKCKLSTTDRFVHNRIVQKLNGGQGSLGKASLINFFFNFTNYTKNPLMTNTVRAYDAQKWSRVTTAHGQTLLSLAFNYGVLSMMTLTLGTETIHVELQDSPSGCMGTASEKEKLDAVQYLLMRDFEANGTIKTVDSGRVCHEIILDEAGYAKFRYKCCFLNSITGRIDCTTDIGNIWLTLLYTMLTALRFALLFFGPSLFISAVLSMSKDNVPYVVRLKDKLTKTVCFCNSEIEPPPHLTCKAELNLRSCKGFPRLKNCAKDVPLGQPIKVQFNQYDINVDYKRMLKENTVPVGFFRSLFDTIFKCQIRYVGPFADCCKSNAVYPSRKRQETWIYFFRRIAKWLLIVFLPFPFYLRLIIFYVFEYDELELRKHAIATSGLTESFENSLIHYFTPTHGVFIVTYIIYIATAIVLAFMSRKDKEHRVKKIIVSAFRDLKQLDFTDTLAMIVSNVIWPFKKYGMLGCLVGLIYWPIALPVTIVVALMYWLPTLYLSIRMACYSKTAIFVKARNSKSKKYKTRLNVDQNVHRFETEKVLKLGEDSGKSFEIALDDVDHIKPPEHMKERDDVSLASSIVRFASFDWRRCIKYVFCAFLCILSLYAVVFILSEVIGCFVEIVVFTVMGIIVNAGSLLKFFMLLLLIFVYCCDCFNNISKKYLKMNKALFGEVKGRIKDLSKVTSLPSSLQENCAFKAQELGEQADYESPDQVVKKPARHWMINDLVLFVDSEDTPRIPKQLFYEVCDIRVAGVPGPVYRGHLEAIGQLAKIILFMVFVFMIILSFGALYRISNTRQTMAVLVGGFLPMILRTFLAPPRPDVEMGTVSFKSKMDEVIKNFCQYWPIHDLPFEIVKEEEETKEPAKQSEHHHDHVDHHRDDHLDNNNCAEPMWMDDVDGCGAVSGYVMSYMMALPPETLPAKSPIVAEEAVEKKATEKKVKIEEPLAANEVDVVIHLPQMSMEWLSEWSSIYPETENVAVLGTLERDSQQKLTVSN